MDYYCSVIDRINHIGLIRKSYPALGARDVLIKLSFCGICGSDLSVYSGRYAKTLPYYPGHEYSGTIKAVGSQVTEWMVGDRVTANPNYICGSCDFCRWGRPNLCEKRDSPFFSNGAMAEYMVIHAHSVYRLPDTLDFKAATLTEPLACALNGLSNTHLEQANEVLILGAGVMGLLDLQIIRAYNETAKILLAEPFEARQKMALALGADKVVGTGSGEIKEALKALGQARPDLIVECSGNIEAVKTAFHFIRSGGTVLLVGRTKETETIVVNPAFIARQGITISGSARLTPQNFEQALTWLSQKKIDSDQYIGNIFPLYEIKAAFHCAKSGEQIKTLINCQL